MDYTGFSLYFGRISPILVLAQERSLELNDLGVLPNKAQVSTLYGDFQEAWQKEKIQLPTARSLWRAIFKTIGYRNFILAFSLEIVASGSMFQAPLLLKAINSSNSGVKVLRPEEYWILVALTLIIPLTGTICRQQAKAIFQFMGMQIRNLMAACIYHKTLARKSSQLETGLVTNLFVNDVKSLEEVCMQISSVFTMPAVLAVGLALVCFRDSIAS